MVSKSVNKIEYKTILRDIKYPRIEFKTGQPVLILPKNFRNKQEFLERHQKWIQNKKLSISSAMKIVENKKLGVPKEKNELENFVKRKVNSFSNSLKTDINKIYFRKMRTKWGSCSQSNNLTLNSLLAYLPEHLIEYVVFHEIAHTKERRHAEKFWNIVERKFNDHQKREMELFGYWFLIQGKLKGSVV